MRIERGVETDTTWERFNPTFRVVLFRTNALSLPRSIEEASTLSWATEIYDIRDAELDEALKWAQEKAGADALFAICLLDESARDKGLTWLLGIDANGAPQALDSSHRWRAMLERTRLNE